MNLEASPIQSDVVGHEPELPIGSQLEMEHALSGYFHGARRQQQEPQWFFCGYDGKWRRTDQIFAIIPLP